MSDLSKLEIVRLEAENERLREALGMALNRMENDWHLIDGDRGPIYKVFGNLEWGVENGKEEPIRLARKALAVTQ